MASTTTRSFVEEFAFIHSGACVLCVLAVGHTPLTRAARAVCDAPARGTASLMVATGREQAKRVSEVLESPAWPKDFPFEAQDFGRQARACCMLLPMVSC